MSDDIVARLRGRRGTIPVLCDDAADEIERLRAERDELSKQLDKAMINGR